MNGRVEWRKAPDFHEIASTLKVKTTQIVLVQPEDHLTIVFYTPDDNDHETVYIAALNRDKDDILQLDTLPVEVPGFVDKIREVLRQAKGDQ